MPSISKSVGKIFPLHSSAMSSSPSSRLASAEPSSPDRKKPSLVVVGEGGAICSEIQDGARVPTANAIKHLLGNIPDELRRNFSRIRVGNRSNTPLVMSMDADTERIQQFAAYIKRIAHATKQNIVALVGTHAAAKYASSVSEALCPDDMRIQCGDDEIGRSIILACSRQTAYDSSTDAFAAVNDAVELSAHPQMHGRAGVLFHGKVHPLPGLQRTGEPTVFASRFPTIAHRDQESNDWYFSEQNDTHAPINDCGESFRLQNGIESFDITGDAESAIAAVNSAAEANLQGMVLRTNSRGPEGHLRIDNASILSVIDHLDIPGIVVCDTLHQNGNGNHEHTSAYEYKNISDGEGLLDAEAQILLARWIASAKDAGFTDPEDISGYVQQMLESYEMK
jgi:hypothetical protein